MKITQHFSHEWKSIIGFSSRWTYESKKEKDKILRRLLSLILEIFVEEIQRHREDAGILSEDVLQVVDVSDQIANCVDLSLDDFFLQVMSESRVVALHLVFIQSGMRVMAMDVISASQQPLLDFDRLSNRLNFIKIPVGLDRSLIRLSEAVGGTSLSELLDHLDSLAPCAVRQSVQDLLESRTILQVCSELSRQEEVLVGSDEMIVGEFDEIIVLALVDNQ